MCIRCGACFNICPVYRAIGGHAYGATYGGPIGSVISPILEADAKDVYKLPSASSLCGACHEVCPVKIDIPRLLLDLRAVLCAGGQVALGGKGRHSGVQQDGTESQPLRERRQAWQLWHKHPVISRRRVDTLCSAAIFRLDRQPAFPYAGQEELPCPVGGANGKARSAVAEECARSVSRTQLANRPMEYNYMRCKRRNPGQTAQQPIRTGACAFHRS